jgi:hypothetical protein
MRLCILTLPIGSNVYQGLLSYQVAKSDLNRVGKTSGLKPEVRL